MLLILTLKYIQLKLLIFEVTMFRNLDISQNLLAFWMQCQFTLMFKNYINNLFCLFPGLLTLVLPLILKKKL